MINHRHMKKTICAVLFAFLPIVSQAQEAEPTKHLDFLGISIEGEIDDFTQRMQPRFRLKKRVPRENYNIYEGTVFGHTTLVQANYTRKSRSVYRVLVTPKHINEVAWQDSLAAHYGEPVETPQGSLYQHPSGIILYYSPQGYDSALIYLDNQGNAIFKEEK